MPSITFPSGSILVPTVLDLSSNLASIYSTVCAHSAEWGNAMPTDHTKWDSAYDTVSALSGNWENTYSTVNANSATTWAYQGADLKALSSNWENTYSTVSTNSAAWNNVYSTVNTNSATAWAYQGADLKALSSNWENTYSVVSAGSANWNNTYTTLCSISAGLGNSLTWVQNNSSTMYVDRLGVNTNINSLQSNLKLAVQGDTVIYGNLSSLGTTTLVNVTANVTDALSVVNPGFGSPNAIYISQGGPGAAIKVQNNGSGPLFALVGNGNAGIGTDTPNEKLTVVGNISSTGILYGAGGNSNIWNSAYTTVYSNSAGWASAISIVAAGSGKWDSTYNTTNALSTRWNNSYSTLTSSSAIWTTAYTALTAGSANWQNTYSVVSAKSGTWDQTTSILQSGSGKWDDTNLRVRLLSSNWQNAYTSTNTLSTLWSTASINYIIDGAGNTITTGSKGVIYIPSKFIVTGWRVLADTVANSVKVDIRRFPNGTYKLGSLSSDSLLIDKVNPTFVNELTITNSSSAASNDGNIFAGISANDTIEYFVSQIDGNVKRITVAIAGLKTI
jgi:hypothetical protein